MEKSSCRPMLTRRQLMAGLGGLSTAVVAMPHVARAAARSVRLGLAPGKQSIVGAGATAFAAAITAHPGLSGILTMDVLDNGQAGDDVSMLKNCMQGTLDGVITSSFFVATHVKEVGVLGIPYIFRESTVARQVLDGPLGSELRAVSAAKGVMVLAWGEQGMRHITANKPIREPADLKGLKIRVPPSDLVKNGFRAVGADPAPLALGQLREALRVGEFQAQENPVGNIASLKLNEVQSHLSLTGHNYDTVGFVVSADLMEDLSPEQRQALADCATKGAMATRKAADDSTRDGLVQLKAAGMTIVTDVDRAAMAAAARPYQESLAGIFGVERVRSLIAMNA